MIAFIRLMSNKKKKKKWKQNKINWPIAQCNNFIYDMVEMVHIYNTIIKYYENNTKK